MCHNESIAGIFRPIWSSLLPRIGCCHGCGTLRIIVVRRAQLLLYAISLGGRLLLGPPSVFGVTIADNVLKMRIYMVCYIAMCSSQIPTIDGCIPGRLDPEQPRRILRHPDSKIFFIPYDSLTASAHANPTIEGISSQRIVVEMQPNGITTWKFVPSASRALSVKDEGVWPRVVIICG